MKLEQFNFIYLIKFIGLLLLLFYEFETFSFALCFSQFSYLILVFFDSDNILNNLSFVKAKKRLKRALKKY